ncbi:MAG TPA: dihydroorotate dehydrogenase [Thermoplasmata archaeon]|nr:dihydroorotate dehydrogenase [Thermoplasmata archaeon]
MTGLEVDIVGLRLRNPTMLASGILNETGKSMLEVAKAGAGAIVTKSLGIAERAGHANPCIAEIDCGLLNAMGLPNPGVKEYVSEIEVAKTGGVPVIGSVFGGNAKEIADVAITLAAAGVDAIELNLSCPHAKGYGTEIGSTPEMVRAVCDEVKSRVNTPVFAKLTPNTSSIASLAVAAEEGGADGIVAINTLKGMTICPELKMPVLSNRVGGLSGPAIRSVGVRCVFEIYEAVDIPIIGVGGVSTARDALEYLMAGAQAVQIGTAVRSQGTAVFAAVCAGLSDFMSENGYRTVLDMVGVAHNGGA